MIWKRQTGDRIVLVAKGKDGTNYALGSVTQCSDSQWEAHVFGVPKNNITHQHLKLPKNMSPKEHWMYMVEWHVRNALAGPLGKVLLNIDERAPREEGV